MTCRVYTLADPMEESPGRSLCDPPAAEPVRAHSQPPTSAPVRGLREGPRARFIITSVTFPHRITPSRCVKTLQVLKFSAVVTAHLVTSFPLASLCKALFRSATIQWPLVQLANKAWANVRLPGAPPLPNVGSDRAGPVSGGQWGRDGRGLNEAADRAAAGVQTRKSPARRIGTPIPDSRPNRESGISRFPGQIGNRGFPPRFPAKNRESGPIRGIRFPITE